MSELEADIQRAFPDEYTPDTWQGLIVRFIEQEMPKDVTTYEAYELAAKQYVVSLDLGEPPQKPFPNFSITRACNWLTRYETPTALCYDLLFLRCQLDRYVDQEAKMKAMSAEIKRLREEQTQLKLDSISTERPN